VHTARSGGLRSLEKDDAGDSTSTSQSTNCALDWDSIRTNHFPFRTAIAIEQRYYAHVRQHRTDSDVCRKKKNQHPAIKQQLFNFERLLPKVFTLNPFPSIPSVPSPSSFPTSLPCMSTTPSVTNKLQELKAGIASSAALSDDELLAKVTVFVPGQAQLKALVETASRVAAMTPHIPSDAGLSTMPPNEPLPPAKKFRESSEPDMSVAWSASEVHLLVNAVSRRTARWTGTVSVRIICLFAPRKQLSSVTTRMFANMGVVVMTSVRMIPFTLTLSYVGERSSYCGSKTCRRSVVPAGICEGAVHNL
jgi:hypothetical protein